MTDNANNCSTSLLSNHNLHNRLITNKKSSKIPENI